MTLPEKAVDVLYQAGIKRFVELVIPALEGGIKRIGKTFKSEYGRHLSYSYGRCANVRTLISKDKAISLLSIYVKTKFKHGGRVFDDDHILHKVHSRGKIVISGSGGGGKTVFMKWLWISLFETGNAIPLFIELRFFNGLNYTDFIRFLYDSVSQSKKSKFEEFEESVYSGYFSLLLDGFDEINPDHRDLCEKFILELSRRSSKCAIVVSSRADERFKSWTIFEEYNVQGLDKRRCISLLRHLDYDRHTKNRFISQVKQGLYDEHPTFLSNPLLITMMLITFTEFAEIPKKFYIFYDQAFEALYRKHDITKEGFKRKHFSNLSFDTFKSVFSLVCLISYYENIYEFTEAKIQETIEKSAKILGIELDGDAYLKDIVQNVCVMAPEGLHYIFSHRSFQEYFSAYALVNVVQDKISSLIPEIMKNVYFDDVFFIAVQMNKDFIEQKFIGPFIERLIAAFNTFDGDEIEKYIFATNGFIFCRFRYQQSDSKSGPSAALLNFSTINVDSEIIWAIKEEYGMSPPSLTPKMLNDDLTVVRRIFKKLGREMPVSNDESLTMTPYGETFFRLHIEGIGWQGPQDKGDIVALTCNSSDLKKSTLRDRARLQIDQLSSLLNTIKQREMTQRQSINQIFQLKE